MTKEWYQNVYNAIVNRAKISRDLDYCEEHHILPTCIGGSDDKSNLVKLTAREHFLCHWLLVKIYADKPRAIREKLSHAFNNMCCYSESNNARRINSHLFQYARKHFSENHPCKSEEVKDKIRKSLEKTLLAKGLKLASHKETRICACGCGEAFEYSVDDPKRYIQYHYNKKNSQSEMRVCACGCGVEFECRVESTKRYIKGHHKINPGFRTESQKANTSKTMKKTLAQLTPEELSQRSKNSWGSSDPVARGNAISAGKKGKSTNQQEIMGKKYANMSDEEFIEYIKDRTDRVKKRMTNLRMKYKL